VSAPATPSFLPWLRSGLASNITATAQGGLAPGDTTSLSVAVQLSATGTKGEIDEAVSSPLLRLRGPGEVIGIDPALIIRHDPQPGTSDAESNYLVLVEFSLPDFPWRYTPAAASSDRLQPWIVLVVVEERAGVWLETATANRLPVLHVDDTSRELPDLSQSWAWAHVQVDYDLSDGIPAVLAQSPEAFRSRLLCPRRLLPECDWLACVVPAFEAGRRTGLGLPLSANLGLSWGKNTAGELLLPVYHSWRFQTGPRGDFESLVRRLEPRELPEGVGLRDLDISDPGGGLPEVPGAVISYQGALVSVASQARPWPAAQKAAFKNALDKALNAELVRESPPQPYDALRDDPVVGPPAYANRQAAQNNVPPDGKPPLWFGELNTEPQHRAVAGLGAEVVRRDQEALMAKAWQFAADARDASRILTRARTAWEIARRVRPRFEAFSDEEFVQMAGPALARLRYSSTLTIKGALVGSALPSGVFSGGFRRLTHATPGFLKKTSTGPAPATDDFTRAIVSQPVEFTAQWANVKSPVNADVEDLLQPSGTARSLEVKVGGTDIPLRVGIIVSPYGGDAAPVLALAGKTRSALDPQGALKSMVEARILGLSPGRDQDVPDRAFVSPLFTTPMYRRLAALSVEYLVPGVGDIPDDTLGLLSTRPPFIEAYLAGLNHELGREFLWREYPARLDGTWFQYFWEGGPGAAADVKPLRQWQPEVSLGGHAPKGAAQAGLVLLVRSAILRRYPDLRIYAVEAAWDKQDGKDIRVEAVEGEVKSPLFAARLSPDITVYGFDLNLDQARGSTNPSAPPGYFFVLEQQSGSPRFGLDVATPKRPENAPKSWTDLSWSHLSAKGDPLPAFIDVTGPVWLATAGALPSNSDAKGSQGKDAWGDDAAAMARITFQRPVRMLVHADSMLPETSASKKVSR
jgi:hypothetical protein